MSIARRALVCVIDENSRLTPIVVCARPCFFYFDVWALSLRVLAFLRATVNRVLPFDHFYGSGACLILQIIICMTRL